MRGFVNAAGICGKRACKSLNPSSEYLCEFWFKYRYEGYAIKQSWSKCGLVDSSLSSGPERWFREVLFLDRNNLVPMR
jgi:hypothetical protein